MGAPSLRGMMTGPLRLSREEVLSWHLQYNHYPPIDPIFTGCCLRAIDKAAKGQWDARVLLPVGYRGVRDSRRTIRVADLVEFAHLDDLVERRAAELGVGPEDWE